MNRSHSNILIHASTFASQPIAFLRVVFMPQHDIISSTSLCTSVSSHFAMRNKLLFAYLALTAPSFSSYATRHGGKA